MNAASGVFDGSNKYIRITDIDEESRCYTDENPVSPKGELDDKYLVRENDILFARTGASTGKTYLYKKSDGKLYFAGFLIRISVNCDNNSIFVYNATLTDRYNRWVRLTSMRSGQPGINSQEYSSYKTYYPLLAEQNKIASFLKKLDKRIEKQRKLVELLKSYKRGALSKLFPKNGENTPEYRFAGFTEPWRKRLLGELGSVSMCKRIFKEQTSEVGEIPFYKIGTFGRTADSFISRELFEEYKAKYSYPTKGTILISASGSIGRTVEFTGNDEYFQDSNIVWLTHDKQLDDTFLKCFYEIVEWVGIEGSTIKRLYNDNILKTKIALPSIEEQQTIGKFFRNIDVWITLHQKQFDMLQEKKSGLLQQLFM